MVTVQLDEDDAARLLPLVWGAVKKADQTVTVYSEIPHENRTQAQSKYLFEKEKDLALLHHLWYELGGRA